MTQLHPGLARLLLKDMTIGVMLLDRNDTVTWVNDYAASLLGFNAETVAGHHVSQFSLPYGAPYSHPEPQVRVCGNLVGITQPYGHHEPDGALLMLLDRGHHFVWLLSALSTGAAPTVAANGNLTNAAIMQRLEAEVSRSRRYANPLSCMVVRTDTHDALRVHELARILKGLLRWVDLLGEWDDRTLLVVLPETDDNAAGRIAEKIHHVVEASGAVPLGGFAIAHATWRRGDSVSRLVARACGALPSGFASSRTA